MKERLTDANFPRTADQRVYHLGLRPGEVANRIVTVGSPSRAETIASYLDGFPGDVFTLSSERGFLTFTGRYKGTPISVMSIGMGAPNMDFFVREVRECLAGDVLMVRLGSCGALVDIPVGSIVMPKACVCVTRNVDYDFRNPMDDTNGPPYRISKPVQGDPGLHSAIRHALEAEKPSSSKTALLSDVVNASADSFYSSQGRQTSFPDHNSHLIEHLLASTQDLATLEMETHHLYHLAACWGKAAPKDDIEPKSPLTTGPVRLSMTSSVSEVPEISLAKESTAIRASAAQIVFASRTSQDFITPQQVEETERWSGKAILEALINFKVSPECLHPEEGSVWQLQA